jgi:hypothetical protein
VSFAARGGSNPPSDTNRRTSRHETAVREQDHRGASLRPWKNIEVRRPSTRISATVPEATPGAVRRSTPRTISSASPSERSSSATRSVNPNGCRCGAGSSDEGSARPSSVRSLRQFASGEGSAWAGSGTTSRFARFCWYISLSAVSMSASTGTGFAGSNREMPTEIPNW